jgi:hypothetical protein
MNRAKSQRKLRRRLPPDQPACNSVQGRTGVIRMSMGRDDHDWLLCDGCDDFVQVGDTRADVD